MCVCVNENEREGERETEEEEEEEKDFRVEGMCERGEEERKGGRENGERTREGERHSSERVVKLPRLALPARTRICFFFFQRCVQLVRFFSSSYHRSFPV